MRGWSRDVLDYYMRRQIPGDSIHVKVYKGLLRCPKCQNEYSQEFIPKSSSDGRDICSRCLEESPPRKLRAEYGYGPEGFYTDYYRYWMSVEVAASNGIPATRDTTKFKNWDAIGRGGFGIVFEAINILESRKYAVKRLFNYRPRSMTEVKHLSVLQHQHVVRFHCAWIEEGYHRVLPPDAPVCNPGGRAPESFLYIQTELCRSSLEKEIESIHLDRQQMWRILEQIVNGLAYIHSQNIIHRDVKPDNLLIGFDGQVKIADFGIARLHTLNEPSGATGGLMTGDQGTEDYMAPEVRMQGPAKYTTQADIYSTGVVLGDMATGSHANCMKLVQKLNSEYTSSSLTDNCYAEVILFAHLIQIEPDMRPTCAGLLKTISNIRDKILNRDTDFHKPKWIVKTGRVVHRFVESHNCQTFYVQDEAAIRGYDLVWRPLAVSRLGEDSELLLHVADEYMFSVVWKLSSRSGSHGTAGVELYPYLVRRTINSDERIYCIISSVDEVQYSGVVLSSQYVIRPTVKAGVEELCLYVMCDSVVDMYSIDSCFDRVTIKLVHTTKLYRHFRDSTYFTISRIGTMYVYSCNNQTCDLYNHLEESILCEVDFDQFSFDIGMIGLCVDQDDRIYALWEDNKRLCISIHKYDAHLEQYTKIWSGDLHGLPETRAKADINMMVRQSGDILIGGSGIGEELYIYPNPVFRMIDDDQ